MSSSPTRTSTPAAKQASTTAQLAPVAVPEPRPSKASHAQVDRPGQIGRCIIVFKYHLHEYATFSPNGRMLASDDAANGVLLWNLSSHGRTTLPIGAGDWVESVAFGRSGTRLIAITVKDRGMVWDLQNRRRLAAFQTDHTPGYRAAIGVARNGSTFVYGVNNTIVFRSAARPLG